MRVTGNVTEGFIGFLYSLHTKVRKLVEKMRKDFETTIGTNIKAFDLFLWSIDSNVKWIGLSS